MSKSKTSKKKKSEGEKIQLFGNFLANIWVNSPVHVYKNLNDVISFLHQDKFPYLWPDLKDYIESINEDDNPQEELKFQWLKLYLYHPDKQVRKAVVELNAKNDSWSISQTLCDLLIDPDKDVRTAVYKATWQREKHVGCKLVITKLFYEIKGAGFYSALGQEKAIIALKKLVKYAPNDISKEKFFKNLKNLKLYEYVIEPNERHVKRKSKESIKIDLKKEDSDKTYESIQSILIILFCFCLLYALYDILL